MVRGHEAESIQTKKLGDQQHHKEVRVSMEYRFYVSFSLAGCLSVCRGALKRVEIMADKDK